MFPLGLRKEEKKYVLSRIRRTQDIYDDTSKMIPYSQT